jgi:two-component system sensor histidine kinase/response regulator
MNTSAHCEATPDTPGGLNTKSRKLREQAGYVHAAAECAKHLTGTLQNLLDFKQIESRTLCLNPEDFAIRDLLEDCVVPLGGRANKKQIELLLAVEPDVPERLHSDPGRLRQILSQLIHNAVKFTEKGGVYVHCFCKTGPEGRDLICIEITDTGPGLPEPFSPAMENTGDGQNGGNESRSLSGIGIGLTVCKQPAALLGGGLDIRNGPQGGCCCRVTFPLEHTGSPERSGLPPGSLSGSTLLVVEDHDRFREYLVRYFQHFGAEVQAAGSVYEALHILESAEHLHKQISMIFIDQDLTGSSGSALAASLRSDDRLRHIPLVMIGSESRTPPSHASRNGSGSLILPKPLRESDLCRVLQSLNPPPQPATSTRSTP